jgi:lysozyme family protein
MSEFSLAIPIVLRHEGAMSFDPHDAGGPTHYGISSGFLAGDINHDGVIDAKDIQDLGCQDAIALYHHYWWQPYGYERIENQSLATKVFDLTVNMGATASHRCLQRAVRAAGGPCLSEDGVLGPKTLAAINNLEAGLLLTAYRSEAAGYYRSLHQPRFEKGWLNRAYA